MSIQPFKLERYFARYEFKVKYLLSCSDCESLGMAELLDMASDESRALWQDLRLGYTESQGNPQLRAEIAGMYRNIRPENVLIAAPEEAIFLAMHTLLQPGDDVIVVEPAYQSLYEIAASLNCSITPWRLAPGAAGWQLNLDRLRDLISARTRLLVMNFPNNPTGYLPTRDEFTEIVSIARRHGVRIFCDEMYRYLEPEPALRLPSICEVYEKGVALCGLSKSFAMPGLRIGWLATQETGLVDRWLALKDYTTICSSAPSEILGIIALQNRDAIAQRSVAIVRENTAVAERFFAEHGDRFVWHKPNAGSIAFPQWTGRGSVEQFSQALLDKQGVMIVPGELFDYPGNYFRVGLGRKNFPEALGKVEEFLAA